MHKHDNNILYVDDTIRLLTEYKWEILSYIDIDMIKKIRDEMEKLESSADELRTAIIMQNLFMKTKEEEKFEKQFDKIYDDIKPKIYDIIHYLQCSLIEYKQTMSCELENTSRYGNENPLKRFLIHKIFRVAP